VIPLRNEPNQSPVDRGTLDAVSPIDSGGKLRSMSRIWVTSFFGIFRAKQKTCEACAAQFECASLAKPCWCRKVELSADALAELKSRYTDCLCPDCLNKVARKTALPAGLT
jgi:hypothetical protein